MKNILKKVIVTGLALSLVSIVVSMFLICIPQTAYLAFILVFGGFTGFLIFGFVYTEIEY